MFATYCVKEYSYVRNVCVPDDICMEKDIGQIAEESVSTQKVKTSDISAPVDPNKLPTQTIKKDLG